MKRKTGVRETDDRVRNIIQRGDPSIIFPSTIIDGNVVTIQTGALTALTASLDAILFLALPVRFPSFHVLCYDTQWLLAYQHVGPLKRNLDR